MPIDEESQRFARKARAFSSQGELENYRAAQAALRHGNAVPSQLLKWEGFVKEVFGREIDVFALTVPTPRGDINFPLVVTEDLPALVAKCKERFVFWEWTKEDLSKITRSDRTAKKGAYVVFVRQNVEADREHRNKSANELKREGVIGITLEERLIYELFHHWETGEHLDPTNACTLCTSSRFSSGGVPSVYWYDGRLRVFDGPPDHHIDGLRVRQAVSI